MIQEKPYAYIKKLSAGPPATYDVAFGVRIPNNYKIGNVKDNQWTGPTPPAEEHSISIVLVADSSSPTPLYVDSTILTITQAAAETYVRIYLVDDTPQGMGATAGTVAVRIADSD